MPTWHSDLRRWQTTYKGLSPWPTTVEGWIDGARHMGLLMRDTALEVASEIGAQDLVERIQAEPADTFPAARYVAELNQRQREAGDLVEKRAGERLRRE